MDHLKKFTQYSIVVQAFNRVGAGPRSQELTVSTAEDGKTDVLKSRARSKKSGKAVQVSWLLSAKFTL